MKAAVLLLCLFIGVVYSATPWKMCSGFSSSSVIDVTNVTVPGCNKPPCTLKKGQDAKVDITFKTNADMTVITNKLYGHIAGINVPFPSFPASATDVCKLLKSGGPCPFKKGSTYSETVVFPVSSSFPSISTTARWKLKDKDGDDKGCFEIPVKLSS